MLNIALPKGRLGNQVFSLFESLGLACPEFYSENRKLVIENKENGVRYQLIKPSDVGIYVSHGVADIGVVGKDVLLETEPDVYELLDLNLGKCSLAVAAKNDYVPDNESVLKVATKYPHVAAKYYRKQNRNIEIIKLNGSVELAAAVGLSDVIVDIVETGSTLKENDMKVFETVAPVNAVFIANKSSFKFKNREITQILEGLSEVTIND